MGLAPTAIWRLWSDIEDKWRGPGTQDEVFAGIVGDRNHSFGYHLSPLDLHALGTYDSDYSLQTERDKNGARANPDMASALDVHFGPVGMVVATKRLIASARDVNDPRLDCLYEFCGTTNGITPHPYTVDTQTDDPSNTQGWDDSHVTHVHLSIHRDVCTNYAAIKGVADVLAGIPLESEFTMDAQATAAFAALNARIDKMQTDVDSLVTGHDGHKHHGEVIARVAVTGKTYKEAQADWYSAPDHAAPKPAKR